MELLQPLAVLHIGFAAGHVADMACVDQHDFDFRLLKLLGERHPVDAGRFDRHRGDAAPLQPIDQSIQSAGKRAEGANRRFSFWNTRRRHCRIVFLGAHIDPASMLVDRAQPFGGALCFHFAGVLFRAPLGFGCRDFAHFRFNGKMTSG